jgi:uncharacterized protein DUF3558
LVVVEAAVLACTACAGHVEGEPAAGVTADVTASSTGDMPGAPHVSKPLDVSPYLARPCAILSAAQLSGLHLRPVGYADVDSDLARDAGPGCTWSNPEKFLGTKITYVTANRHGLADLYRGHGRGEFALWEPTTVAGYPAVINDGADLRASGSCGVTVGVSDTMTFLIGEEDSSDLGPRACDRGRQVAAMVVHSLGG